jgi:hypothetical protein
VCGLSSPRQLNRVLDEKTASLLQIKATERKVRASDDRLTLELAAWRSYKSKEDDVKRNELKRRAAVAPRANKNALYRPS